MIYHCGEVNECSSMPKLMQTDFQGLNNLLKYFFLWEKGCQELFVFLCWRTIFYGFGRGGGYIYAFFVYLCYVFFVIDQCSLRVYFTSFCVGWMENFLWILLFIQSNLSMLYGKSLCKRLLFWLSYTIKVNSRYNLHSQNKFYEEANFVDYIEFGILFF